MITAWESLRIGVSGPDAIEVVRRARSADGHESITDRDVEVFAHAPWEAPPHAADWPALPAFALVSSYIMYGCRDESPSDSEGTRALLLFAGGFVVSEVFRPHLPMKSFYWLSLALLELNWRLNSVASSAIRVIIGEYWASLRCSVLPLPSKDIHAIEALLDIMQEQPRHASPPTPPGPVRTANAQLAVRWSSVVTDIIYDHFRVPRD